MSSSALSYRILDAQDREVAVADSYGRACRIARYHGPGATVLGAKGQVLYVVKEEKK